MKQASVGIYAFKNIVSGFCYVGQSIDMDRRRKQHLSALRAGKHHSSYLQNSFSSNGEGNFEYLVLENCTSNDLMVTEQKWMDHYRATGLFNSAPAAGSAKGIVRSAETRAKQSASSLGKKKSAEHIKNLSIARTGVPLGPHKESTKLKMSLSHTGKVLSEATKLKLRLANLGKVRGPNSLETNARIGLGNLGKVVSAEARVKISKANTGKFPSIEAKLKMSLVKLGKKKSAETKARMSIAQQKPRNLSDETRAKMRLSRVGLVVSQETRDKLSAAGKGRVMADGALAKAWATRRQNTLNALQLTL